MGAKQFRTWVRKKKFDYGPKREECGKGGGCEAVSSTSMRWARPLRISAHLIEVPSNSWARFDIINIISMCSFRSDWISKVDPRFLIF